MTVSTGIITTIAGNGTPSYSGDNGQATSASLSLPSGVALDSSGSQAYLRICFSLFLFLFYLGNVYIADRNNNRIRKVTVSTGIVTTFAGTGTAGNSGDGGVATSATISPSYGVALDSSGTQRNISSSFH